ncbi:hypothetical protein EGI26_01785 [Lacihabitans sp. CCS-44]|nr:hypothetical protein [Lacihabitans sp. CCS-44]
MKVQFEPKKTPNYTINYDKKGNISGLLPHLLFKDDEISIKPLGNSSEFRDHETINQLESLNDSLKSYSQNLDKFNSHYLLPKLFSDNLSLSNYRKKLFQNLNWNYHLKLNSITDSIFKDSLTNYKIVHKTREFKIQIIKPNLKWQFDTTYLGRISKHKFQNWDKFKPQIQTLVNSFNLKAKVIDSLITKFDYDVKIRKDSLYPWELMYNLLTLEDTRKELDSAITKLVIEPNKEILKASLLLSGSNPSFNPLGLPEKNLSSSISNSKSTIEKLEKQIKDRQTANVKTHPPIDSDNLKKLEELYVSLDIEKKKLTGLEGQLTSFNSFKTSLKNNGTILNEIKFFISDSSEINWMRHYSDNNDIEIKNSEKLIPSLISDIDQISPTVHNIPKGTKVFSTETVKGYEIKTPFAEVVDGIIDQVLDTSLSNKKFSGLGNILAKEMVPCDKNTNNSNLKTGKDLKKLCQNIWNSKKNDSLDSLGILRNEVSNFKNTSKLKEWHESIKIPVTLELPKTFSMDTLMRSEWIKPKSANGKKGANEISYSIKTNNGKTTDTLELSKKYKTYDLKRSWPFAGIAYVPSPRNTSVFDAATNTFVSNPNPEQLDILVGVKYYPFKGFNQTRTPKSKKQTDYGFPYKYLRGNAFINSVSVSGSLSVRYKFLRNYFLGVGFDIIPGLNLQVGGNMYFQNRYELENGKLVKASERPLLNRGYFALTTDVSILGKLVKFINPF